MVSIGSTWRICRRRISIVAAVVAYVWLVCSVARAQQPIPPLEIEFEIQDGTVEDIAAQHDALTGAAAKRAWLAQGRVRAAFGLSDRLRKFSEDRTFSLTTNGPHERLLAIEVDDTSERIYTLTDKALYRESFSSPFSPSSPGLLGWIDLTGFITPSGWGGQDPLLDVKVSPLQDARVFVLTTKRILVISDSATSGSGALSVVSSADELFNQGPGGYFQGNLTTLQAKILKRMVVLPDGPKLMAYVTVEMYSYQTNRPLPLLVIACHLNNHFGSAPPYQNPTFDSDPSAGTTFTFYNPLPSPPSDTHTVDSQKIMNLDAVQDSVTGKQLVYLACAAENQVIRLDATNCFQNQAFVVDGSHAVSSGADVLNVLAHRWQGTSSTRRFFSVSRAGFSVTEWTDTSSASDLTQNEPMPLGLRRDMEEISYVPPPPGQIFTVWTAGYGNTDHVCKMFDVTAPGDEADLRAQWFSISSSDGGVAIGNDVYIPTFAGVVRYVFLPGPPARFRAVPGSYRSTEEVPDSGTIYITEHIDKAFLPGSQEPDRLLTATALGDFEEFPIDVQSRNPKIPKRWLLSVGKLPPVATWQAWPNGPHYGNDVAFYEALDGSKWVLTDLTNFDVNGVGSGNRSMQIALLAFRWDSVQDEWEHVVTVVMPTPILYSSPTAELSNSITITKDKNFAIIGHDLGMWSVSIQGLASATPTMTSADSICTDINPPPCQMFPVFGLAHSKNRIFAWINDGNVGKLRLYDFNQTSGDIGGSGDNWIVEYSSFGVAPFQTSLPRGFRGRFRELTANGKGDALFACDDQLVQVRWDDASPDVLTYRNYWQSDYDGPLQDCRLHTFPGIDPVSPRILVVKDSEAFAVVRP